MGDGYELFAIISAGEERRRKDQGRLDERCSDEPAPARAGELPAEASADHGPREKGGQRDQRSRDGETRHARQGKA